MSESAQRMIQRVTHKYGDSYTMLWLFEVIGETNDDLLGMVDDFKHQLVPQTATWSLPIWEESLGLPVDVTLSIDVRRMAIIEKKRKRVPMNPARIEEIVSAIVGGADTWMDEYAGKNRFTMHINDIVDTDVMAQVVAKLKKIKQSHKTFDVSYEKKRTEEKTLYFRSGFIQTRGRQKIPLNDETAGENKEIPSSLKFGSVVCVRSRFKFPPPIKKTTYGELLGNTYDDLRQQTYAQILDKED